MSFSFGIFLQLQRTAPNAAGERRSYDDASRARTPHEKLKPDPR